MNKTKCLLLFDNLGFLFTFTKSNEISKVRKGIYIDILYIFDFDKIHLNIRGCCSNNISMTFLYNGDIH